ncbi:hypothetical protein B0H19DRAFT_1288781 [Mycena capillaripes]|nr:hypothetical protein B0H19DRAFT_1288781 [Mycena capillaripes]
MQFRVIYIFRSIPAIIPPPRLHADLLSRRRHRSLRFRVQTQAKIQIQANIQIHPPLLQQRASHLRLLLKLRPVARDLDLDNDLAGAVPLPTFTAFGCAAAHADVKGHTRRLAEQQRAPPAPTPACPSRHRRWPRRWRLELDLRHTSRVVPPPRLRRRRLAPPVNVETKHSIYTPVKVPTLVGAEDEEDDDNLGGANGRLRGHPRALVVLLGHGRPDTPSARSSRGRLQTPTTPKPTPPSPPGSKTHRACIPLPHCPRRPHAARPSGARGMHTGIGHRGCARRGTRLKRSIACLRRVVEARYEGYGEHAVYKRACTASSLAKRRRERAPELVVHHLAGDFPTHITHSE